MRIWSIGLIAAGLVASGCAPDPGGDETPNTETQGDGDGDGDDTDTDGETGDPPQLDVHGFANGCYAVRSGDRYLAASDDGTGYGFGAATADDASRFFMKASDLGTYLLYDEDGAYLVADDGPLLRRSELESDLSLVNDSYISGAEWLPQNSQSDDEQYWLLNRRNDSFLALDGLDDIGASLTFETVEGCREHPELSLDASGEVMRTTFEDGDLYGIVDTHSHILSNFGFGGGGIFHGGAFHRLGVEHALPDCAQFHGEMGRKDFFGFAFDTAGANGADLAGLLPDLIGGELSEDNHATAGYPEFTDWPNGPSSSTHQTQYYRWLERAYLGGLRLVVQHATTNSAICHFMVGEGIQETRYDCEDMTAVDRILDETVAMERYIDAQSGGPGEGWFRIVRSPAEAREVIGAGKMAVILGIETSNLFDCKITPSADDPTCDADYVREQLDYYYDLGVRAIFPVHKYDNAFTPGDGDRAFIELGNFVNSGHWSNFTDNCPAEVTDGFDRGDVFFGGLNQPRDNYLAAAPLDFSAFPAAPVTAVSLFLTEILAPALEGDYCQNATLTELGETLLDELMQRGMIIEVDHFPQWSYQRAFEILEDADYPAVGTHGRNFNGLLYQLGGISKTSLRRCHDAANPGSSIAPYQAKIDLIVDNGGYPAEGFGLDLNGFAGAPRARFAEGACPTPQENPVTYPFRSYADDVEFSTPFVGERELDFNFEGLAHIGLLPELIEDARKDALSDADLEPLFRSAEGYIRMWELAEERGAALRGG